MSTQIVEFPAQAGSSPVTRLGRAAEQPARTAWAVQQAQCVAGEVQLQGGYLQQHMQAGSATAEMVRSLRAGLRQVELRLEGLVDELGDQHVELAELTDLLNGLGIEQGEGRWSA